MGLHRLYRGHLRMLEDRLLHLREQLLDQPDQAALHAFRLTAKAIMAFRRWQARLPGHPPAAWPALRRAFRASGHQRDQHVLARPEHPSDGADPARVEVIPSLQALRPAQIRRKGQRLRGRLPRRGQRRLARALEKEIRRRQSRLRHLTRRLPGARALHRMRRELKELLYLLKPALVGQTAATPLRQACRPLDRLQSLLGDWHDAYLMRQADTSSPEARHREAALRQKALEQLAPLPALLETLAQTWKKTWI